MSTEIAHAPSTALTIASSQTAFTEAQEAALRQIGVQANTPGDIAVLFHQSKRTGLDPFKREIYMITRQGKATIQTGIDGFYKIADRATRNAGGTWGIPETLWCGEDGQWRDVWLSNTPPAAAKVTVLRNGSAFTTVALTSEYMAEKSPMWRKMPARMIAKCAEALAIRRAFPDDLSGLYTSDEMQQADGHQQAQERPAQPRQESKPFDPQAALQEAWDSPERLTALGKWSTQQGAPEQYTQQIRDRIADLNNTTTEPQEAEIVDEG